MGSSSSIEPPRSTNNEPVKNTSSHGLEDSDPSYAARAIGTPPSITIDSNETQPFEAPLSPHWHDVGMVNNATGSRRTSSSSQAVSTACVAPDSFWSPNTRMTSKQAILDASVRPDLSEIVL